MRTVLLSAVALLTVACGAMSDGATASPIVSAPRTPRAAGPMRASTPAGDVLARADAAFYACTADADCVAVRQNGCCWRGEMEAVNAEQIAAYAASFTCPETQPVCPPMPPPSGDARVPLCNAVTLRCELLLPTEIPCGEAGGGGGVVHACPAGYECARASEATSPPRCHAAAE